uniref:13-62 protein isoform 1 n=1 Tax=Craterostigma plantagineum TaxID=4153 RepID=A0A2U8JD30_CRAPL|nr:13-62 protein isoform 1 [Craterostigma plantagineum]
MAQQPTFASAALVSFFLALICSCSYAAWHHEKDDIPKSDVSLLEFPLNLELLEAEFFAWAAFGKGIDELEPELAKGGPSPIGVQKANLSPFIRDIIAQFAYQEFGHVRAIQSSVEGFPRPLLDLSAKSFATVMDSAFGKTLKPPFDPYANDINYLLACYVVPYVGLTGYVGANPKLESPVSRKLVAGLLAVEAGQDAIIRALLYERATDKVEPYGITVAEFTNKISELRNKLGDKGVKDLGLIVEPELGAEGKISGNVLAGDKNSLAFPRTPEEVLRIVYSSGDEAQPGGFYPKGANGQIAKSHLENQSFLHRIVSEL